MNFKKIILCLLLLLTPLVIGGGVFVAQSNVQEPTQNSSMMPDDHWLRLQERVHAQVRRFPGTAGIIIKDLKLGWVIEYNSTKLFPSASLIKIPIMATLYQAQLKGQISLDESLPLLRKLKTNGSGSLKFQKTGTRLTVRQLIFKMITESDNTATNMLTNVFGLDYYNTGFMNLGLSRTNFSRTIMDLRRRDQGVENYTTPEDMAKLLEMIYQKKLTGSEEMLEILKCQKINDRLSVGLPHGWQIGHKTGLMRNTCHDVGIIFAPNSEYVICALTQNIRSYRRAKHFIGQISHITAEYYANSSTGQSSEKRTLWTKLKGRKRLQAS